MSGAEQLTSLVVIDFRFSVFLTAIGYYGGEDFLIPLGQTANYVVRTGDLPRNSRKNNSLLFKTMARRASPARTLQSYQSGP